MKVIFIGSGNLATNLARELHAKGEQIVQVFSRMQEAAESLSRLVSSTPTTDLQEIDRDADLYVFSVKDSVLESLLAQMPLTQGLWVHTAGSIPLSVFEKYHGDFGVIYPFQTFSKNKTADFRELPIFIEANNERNLEFIQSLAAKISSQVIPLSTEKRKYIHLSGVFACNFVNHLYSISGEILKSQDIPFDVLLPLIDETAQKVHELTPKEAQTGPAVRYDENVMQKHLSLLTDDSQKQIYELISKNIYKTNQ